MSNRTNIINISTVDGVEFRIDVKYLIAPGSGSVFFQDMLVKNNSLDDDIDYGSIETIEGSEDDSPIPLPDNVHSEELTKVLEYMGHHYKKRANKIDRPLRNTFRSYVSQWDYDYVSKMDYLELNRLINAVNFLNVPDLFSLLCAYYADIIKGKNVDQLKVILNIPQNNNNTLTSNQTNSIMN
jgi:hypothetical protein